MSNEEIISVECVLRNYEQLIRLWESQTGNNNFLNTDMQVQRGKIEGAKEVLRDLMNSKISK